MADKSEITVVSKGRRVRRPEAGVGPVLEGAGLQDEIRMMRIIMRRVVNLAEEGCTLDEVMRVLDTVGRASTRLAGLLKAANELDKEHGVETAFSLAISQITEELKLTMR